MTPLWLLPLGLFGWLLWHKWKTERDKRRELIQYAQRTHPIIEHSRHPGDDAVAERAAYHKAMLQESGNQWAVDVFEFHFRDLKEAKGNHLAGFDSWEDYLIALGKYTALALDKHNRKVKGDDPNAHREHILKQTASL